jgi:hypothetical protein
MTNPGGVNESGSRRIPPRLESRVMRSEQTGWGSGQRKEWGRPVRPVARGDGLILSLTV